MSDATSQVAGGPARAPAGSSRPRPWTWRLGSIAGIGLYAHATLLLFLVWVAVSHYLQGEDLILAIEGVVLMAAVFGVVLLHELGHALVAKRFGIRTRDIVLFPFGGVASLERLPERPGQEMLVAVAGPAVNLAIALLLLAWLATTGQPFAIGVLESAQGPLLAKLMWINVSLATFNMLPAFPMDGGRVLRAALAMGMDRTRATEIAARIGQAMALLFGIAGLFVNPMLLIIALFVWTGARQESSALQLKAALHDVPVRSAMITDFQVLSPDDSLGRASELLLAGFQHDFPVLDRGRIVGVLTRDDLVRGLAVAGPGAPVARVMHADVSTAHPAEALDAVLDRLQSQELPLLVVVDGPRPIGLLTPEHLGELVVLRAVRHSSSTSGRETAAVGVLSLDET